jgi:hypothetical protein
MPPPAAAPDAIIDLLCRFELWRDTRFTGTDELIGLRREFIDPFFGALGWDMQDSTGPDRVRGGYVRHGRVTTRDNATCVTCLFGENGIPQFLVVQEKPSACIRDSAGVTLGPLRYAWNAEIPLLIITNFAECAIYDCTRIPEPRGTGLDARIAYFTFRDYPGEWAWISSIFSKEAVIGGSIRDYAAKAAATHGSAGVAEVFLRDLEKWRETLARNIVNRNHTITTGELNDAVHQTIYRIVFFRICRDRGINAGETLTTHLNGTSPPWTIDGTLIDGMIERLSGPVSPYDLPAIPLPTLAAIFGRFIEKSVTMRGGHHAMIETKPAGRDPGIRYPPPRILVEYMVRHMVGDLTVLRTPREIAPVRILDPSCRAGLFLSGVYQALLDWHLDWYTTHLIPALSESSPSQSLANGLPLPPGEFPVGKCMDNGIALPVYIPGHDAGPGGPRRWRLTFGEKTRILLTNIYGVDIDRQTVGVTILLLVLQLIEDEDGTTPDLSRILENVLLTLHQHIRCGNALIGPDYFDLGQTHPYHYREEKRVNPFSWHAAFPDVMERGGFDAIIGNPPSSIPDFTRDLKKYFQTHYSVYRVTTDLTPYCIEKGILLLTPGGTLSLLVSAAWLRAGYGKPMRKFLMNRQIVEIIDFGSGMHEISGSCILRISNVSPAQPFRSTKVKTLEFADLDAYVRSHGHPVDQAMLNDGGWTLEDTRNAQTLQKIRGVGKPLGEYVLGRITRGTVSRFPPAAVIDEQTKIRLFGQDSSRSSHLKPFLHAKDIHRYSRPRPGHYTILMQDHGITSDADEVPDSGKVFPESYPVITRHPAQFRSSESTGSDNQDTWCERRASDPFLSSLQARIISPSHAEKPSFTLDTGTSLADEQITIIPYPDLYLLGILNSKVTDFFIRATTTKHRNRYYPYIPRSISRIPVYIPDFDDPVDRGRHDQIEELVIHLLDLHERLMTLMQGRERSLVKKEIAALEGAIDTIVYAMYGLTREECMLINEETSGYHG